MNPSWIHQSTQGEKCDFHLASKSMTCVIDFGGTSLRRKESLIQSEIPYDIGCLLIMDNLRLILLLTGCLLVLGIYLWDIFFRREARGGEDMLEAVDDLPDPGIGLNISPGADQHGHASAPERANLGSLLPKSRDARLAGDERPAMPLNPRAKTGSAEVAAGPLSAQKQGATDDRLAEDKEESEGLLILHIVSPDETGFNGVSIREAASGAGMVFGRMDIFHHFGSGGPEAAEPWFSMANMYEPGAFDRAGMAELQTRGVVVFMYPPSAPEPGAVFDLFLDATQTMARALGGEILTAGRLPLTVAATTALREGVISAPGKSAD